MGRLSSLAGILLVALQVAEDASGQPVAGLDLYDAIRMAQLPLIEEYLAEGGDPNAVISGSPLGRVMPLKVAVFGRRESIALVLLRAGARIEPAGLELRDLSAAGMDEALALVLSESESADSGALKAALDAAVTFGYFDSVHVLLDALRRSDENESTILWDAMNLSIGRGYDDIARLLLDNGAPASGAALRAASLRSSPGLVQYLLRLGADPLDPYRDPLADIRPGGRDGFTAVDYAWEGYQEGTPPQQQAATFKLFELLAAGGIAERIDVSSVAIDGAVALSGIENPSDRLLVAADWGFYYTVQELTSGRHDPTTLTEAVIRAIDSRWDDIARLLLREGAPAEGGPLHFAVRRSSPGLVRYLLELGADPNELVNGYTAVHYWWRENPAIPEDGPRGGHGPDVLHELVAHGADVCWLVEHRDELGEFGFSLNVLLNSAPQCWSE